MIAIVKVGGHQEIVKTGEVLEVDKLPGEAGTKIKLETLLLSDENGANFQVGAPILENVFAEAEILEHGRDPKIRVFKMKPRKRYRRTKGHKQDHTKIKIVNISTDTKSDKAPPEDKNKNPVKEAAPKPATKSPKTN